MGIGWDRPEQTMLRQLNDTTLIGYRYSSGWANDQRVHFAIIVSKPIAQFEFRPATT
jgi:hypothetical protein